MKKTILLTVMIAASLLSCSKDDDATVAPSQMKVLGLSRGATPGQPETFSVDYGTSSDDMVHTEITQAVYDHYMALAIVTPNPRWRGEITE